MTAPGAPEPPPVSVRTRIASRLAPALALAVAMVTLAPPAVYFAVRVAGIRARARQVAARTAAVLGKEARIRPRLWRYDTPKILASLEHTRAFEPAMAVQILDRTGRRLARVEPAGAAAEPGGPRVWARAQAAQKVSVWVALPAGGAVVEALWALAGAGALGLCIGWWIRRTALAEAVRADADLAEAFDHARAAHDELAALAADLEQTVARRSAALRAALDDARAKDARLRELSAKATAAVEKQRRSIARELHDGVGQTLTAIRLRLEVLAATAGTEAKAAIASLVSLCDEAIAETRRAVDRLRPPVLDDVGLPRALERLCADHGHATGVTCTLAVAPAAAARLHDAPAASHAIYRIVQEGLHNAVRHGAARRIDVRVTLDDTAPGGGAVVVTIEDDGRGFDPEAVELRGLAFMQERAELLGGALTIARPPAGGARLRVVLPAGERSAPAGEDPDAPRRDPS